MITQREDELVAEIYAEGDRKYLEKLNKLAAVLGDGCDSEAMVAKICRDIWGYLREAARNIRHLAILKKHGIKIVDESHGCTSDLDMIVVKNSGCSKNRLHTWHFEPGGWDIEVFGTPSRFTNRTATGAIEKVKKELNLIDLWTVVAERYNAIRKEIDKIETEESDKRVREAKKELELLKKL